jgi:hypothetical protein
MRLIDYSGHLIRHLNASEAFPTEWFFSILGTSLSLVGSCQDCTACGKALAIHTFPKFPILHLRYEAALYRAWLQSVSSSISRLSFAEQGQRSLRYRTQCSLLKSGSQLLRKSEWFISLLATQAQCAELLKWPTYVLRTLLVVRMKCLWGFSHTYRASWYYFYSNNALPDDGNCTETWRRSCFNVNFNVNFKIVFKPIHSFISWWIKTFDSLWGLFRSSQTVPSLHPPPPPPIPRILLYSYLVAHASA